MSLALLYEDAFKTIVRLQSGKLQDQTAADVKKALLEVFAKVDDDAKSDRNRYLEDNLNDAKFALTAFADETACSRDSSIKSDWDTLPNVSLTQKIFNQANAGNDFFRRLERISQTNTTESGDVLEVYCLCLLLGFTGVQRGETLSGTIRNTLNQVERLSGRSPGLRFPNLLVGASHLSERGPLAQRLPSRTIWPLAAVLAATMVYLCFCGSLKHSSDQLADMSHVDRR